MEFATIILIDNRNNTAGMLLVDVTGEAPQVVRECFNGVDVPTHAYLCDENGAEGETPFSVVTRQTPDCVAVHLARLYDALPK